MGKNDCPVCRKTTNAVASNKLGALRCSICDFWYHPPCVQVDSAQMDLIKKCEDLGRPGQAVEVQQPQRPQRRRASTPQLRLVWFRRERMIAKLVATLRTWFRNRSQIVFQSHLLHILPREKYFHTKRDFPAS